MTSLRFLNITGWDVVLYAKGRYVRIQTHHDDAQWRLDESLM